MARVTFLLQRALARAIESVLIRSFHPVKQRQCRICGTTTYHVVNGVAGERSRPKIMREEAAVALHKKRLIFGEKDHLTVESSASAET